MPVQKTYRYGTLPGMESKYPYHVNSAFTAETGDMLKLASEIEGTSVRALIRRFVVTGVTMTLINAGKLPNPNATETPAGEHRV